MSSVTAEEILQYVATNIDSFHQSRLAKLNSLRLDELLGRKNPYLFKSKNIVTASDLIGLMLDAYLSSQEEELFGVFLEGLAVFIASKTIGGRKSTTTGIDLEFDQEKTRYIISIKSGPHWGNSSQINKMKDNFTEATRVLRQGNMSQNVIAVNGCCYGRDSKPNKGSYFKICGQEFWELISGDRGLYTRIIEPLAHNAKQRNDAFREEYGPVLNLFVEEFVRRYCINGVIDWPKLVSLSSAVTPFIEKPASKRYVNRISGHLGVCDTLRNWGWPALATQISNTECKDSPEFLNSAKGLLLVLGSIQYDGILAIEPTSDGLINAEWKFADGRGLRVEFFDIDHVKVLANDSNGKPIGIRNGGKSSRRQTAIKMLIEKGFFTLFEDN